MTLQRPIRKGSRIAAICAAVFSTALCLSPPAKAGEVKLRFVCATTLEEAQELIIATRDDSGKWQEHGKLEPRPSLITAPISAEAGELHLVVRKEAGLESICQFTAPGDSKLGLVVLIAEPETKTYKARFLDPAKDKFEKGSDLVINFSERSTSVFFGEHEEKVGAGQQVVVKAPLEENGMFRMQVSYTDDAGTAVACYDRYVSGNPNSRNMLFLLHDESSGLRALTLSLLGELE